MKSNYERAFLSTQNRLLNLLNKNPASETYGCFDRSYWLHKKSDFPTSTAQLSVLTFSYFYKHQLSDHNHFFQNKNILNWILASLKYTISIQNSDGSYDEWYPNERGWGGPTGYIVSAMAETYLQIQEQIPDHLKKDIQTSLRKSVDFLLVRDESDVLTNHYAITLNGIVQANEILKEPQYLKSIDQLLEKILSLYTNEGWSLEYDGCDLGYNLGTLNFLVEVYKITQDKRILTVAQRAFSFLSYFISPDHLWMSNLSSRHTIHNYYYALEFWSHHCKEAHPLLCKLRQALINHHDLQPMDQEDHYLHYRTSDYIKAYLNFNDQISYTLQLAYEHPDFSEIYFPESGFLIKKIDKTLVWISTKRGGAFTVYQENKCIHINNGVLFKDLNGHIYTNLWQSSKKVDAEFTIQSICTKVFDTTFKPSTFIVFRFLLIFMRNASWAYYLKRLIRRALITFKAQRHDSLFTRKLQFSKNNIVIEDLLTLKKPIQKLYCGGNFHTRYVPQGHYFQHNDIDHQPAEIPVIDFRKVYKIKTTIHIDTNKVDLCVE